MERKEVIVVLLLGLLVAIAATGWFLRAPVGTTTGRKNPKETRRVPPPAADTNGTISTATG